MSDIILFDIIVSDRKLCKSSMEHFVNRSNCNRSDRVLSIDYTKSALTDNRSLLAICTNQTDHIGKSQMSAIIVLCDDVNMFVLV